MVKERGSEGCGSGGASACGGTEGWSVELSVSDIVGSKRVYYGICVCGRIVVFKVLKIRERKRKRHRNCVVLLCFGSLFGPTMHCLVSEIYNLYLLKIQY